MQERGYGLREIIPEVDKEWQTLETDTDETDCSKVVNHVLNKRNKLFKRDEHFEEKRSEDNKV